MSVIGIGTDLIEVSRIKKAADDIFLKRYFTFAENCLFNHKKDAARYQTIAANFAVKEAVSKAAGTGFSRILPSEIETLRDKGGKPYINLSGKAREICNGLGVKKIHVSLTHTAEYAAAFVILED